MKRKLCWIETKKPSDSEFIRKKAAECYKKLRAIRKISSAYVNQCNKFGLNYGDACYNVRNYRVRGNEYINELESKSYLCRKVGLETIAVELSRPESMKGVLDEMRFRVKRFRENRRRCDYLAERGSNYFLNRYLTKVLSSTKKPADDSRYVGIEIECVVPRSFDNSKLMPFAKYINVGTDGSIRIDSDNEKGAEIRVLMKLDEVKSVIPALTKVLVENGAKVNASCGLHVHLDQRQNNQPEIAFQKLVRSLGLLYRIMPKSRRENGFCKKNSHSRFMDAVNGGRYKAVNAAAYRRYRTIEVRLFGGTLNAEKIINWIEVLHAITDGEMVNRCPKNFVTARKYWKFSDAALSWLNSRAEKYSALNQAADTFEAQSELVNQNQLQGVA